MQVCRVFGLPMQAVNPFSCGCYQYSSLPFIIVAGSSWHSPQSTNYTQEDIQRQTRQWPHIIRSGVALAQKHIQYTHTHMHILHRHMEPWGLVPAGRTRGLHGGGSNIEESVCDMKVRMSSDDMTLQSI